MSCTKRGKIRIYIIYCNCIFIQNYLPLQWCEKSTLLLYIQDTDLNLFPNITFHIKNHMLYLLYIRQISPKKL